MPKKHNGSKKSKSQKQSRVQQWVARFRVFTDKAGKQWIHRGPNRAETRKRYSVHSKSSPGRIAAANKGRNKRNTKARNRRQRKAARALHQAQRRAA